MSLPLFLWKLNLSWSDHFHYSSTQKPAATVRASSPRCLGLLCWKIKSPELIQPPLGLSMVPLQVGCAQARRAVCVQWCLRALQRATPYSGCLAVLSSPVDTLQSTAHGSGPKADQWVNGCAELWQDEKLRLTKGLMAPWLWLQRRASQVFHSYFLASERAMKTFSSSTEVLFYYRSLCLANFYWFVKCPVCPLKCSH